MQKYGKILKLPRLSTKKTEENFKTPNFVIQIKQYNSLKDLLGDIYIFLIKKREIDKFSTTAAIFNQSMQFLLSRECNPSSRKYIRDSNSN